MLSRLRESSFRDPSGFIFYEKEKLLRQINKCYQKDYDFLLKSGLYNKLIKAGLLIEHTELGNHKGLSQESYKIIEPELIKFISYPYEWSFNQLKDAAITTLEIQKIALMHGMTLKDSSAYNIQFRRGNAIFIDTLSFEIYEEGQPWQAYKQFCQHFLAPLVLMRHTDIRMNQMLKLFIDGIPLDLTSKLLPFKTKFNVSLLMHIHLHAKTQKKYQQKGTASKNIKIKPSNQIALIQNLINIVKGLNLKKQYTEWAEYYNFTNYNDNSFTHKKEIISTHLDEINADYVWDLGANTGEFSQLVGDRNKLCIAFDIDPQAVNKHYLDIKKSSLKNTLPLVMDLSNPSSSIGWDNNERMSLKQRPLPDVILALAIIHHLAISNNLSFDQIASYFSELTNHLIIEFVPKTDSQVQTLLQSRKDIFTNYYPEAFEDCFSKYFKIVKKTEIIDTERTIYLMSKIKP